MSIYRPVFCDDHNNNVFASPDIVKPFAKEMRILESFTDPDLIRVVQNYRNSVFISWKEVWMVLSNVLFSFFGEVHNIRKIWALKIGHMVQEERLECLKWDWILDARYSILERPDCWNNGILE